MPLLGCFVLLFLMVFVPTAAALAPGSACLDAATTAERDWMLPADLVAAIGRVESGRADPATGRLAPWPWTVNANGIGNYFNSRTEAVGFVRTLLLRGVRLVDVGCFQIDLFYHPAAFTSLEQAFDPTANAGYAARFLAMLHTRTGNWASAVANYYSGLEHERQSYLQKVMSQWKSGAQLDWISVRPVPAGRQPDADRYVVIMSAAARAIRTIRP